MLEDESGRLRLVGSLLSTTQLVTGAVVAVLGTENSNGDFEILDVKVPDLARQPRRWENGQAAAQRPRGKIAFVSGLGITGTSSDTLGLELLTDFLLGYSGSPQVSDETSPLDASRITRLIIAGNALGASATAEAASTGLDSVSGGAKKKNGPKKYGYDASMYNASPVNRLDSFLSELLPSIPITLMPGENDPANVALPQQAIHRAMLPRASAYGPDPAPSDGPLEPGWFDSVTNPWEGDVEGWRLLGSSGQNVDDVLRYLEFSADDTLADSERADVEARLKAMEAMMRWRCSVPTAPDTICSFPLFFNFSALVFWFAFN